VLSVKSKNSITESFDEYPGLAMIYYEKIAKNYNNQNASLSWRLLDYLTKETLQPFLPHDVFMLDVGCGTGKWSMIMCMEQNCQSILLDISKQMLRLAKHKCAEKRLLRVVDFVRADVRFLPFRKSIFDLILAELDVISYCKNTQMSLKEFNRVIKDQGVVHASVDSVYDVIRNFLLESKIDEAINVLQKHIFSFDNGDGVKVYSKAFLSAEIKDFFEKCGFDVVRIVGNPIVLHLLPKELRNKLMSNEELFAKILEIEVALYRIPSLVDVAPHIEVLAKKSGR
jgi:ubiquinone/menaquinone biosynthesis C-methylase UbiE